MKLNKIIILFAAAAAVTSFASCGSSRRVAKTETNKEVAIVAHRGFWNCEEAGYAKNSIAALVQAQKNGFWGSEFDVNMTSDEELLVFHDSSVEGKKIEKNPASAFSYYTLKNGEKIPTLDQYLEQGAKSKTMLVLELKTHSTDAIEDRAAELCVQKLKEHNLFENDRVIFISFSMNICKKFAELAPGFTVQYLDTDYTTEQVKAEGVNGIDINYKDLLKDPKRYDQARANGMSVNSWTVNNKESMMQLIDLGIDQITTDNPLDLRALTQENGIKEVK